MTVRLVVDLLYRLVVDFRLFVEHDLHLDLDWMSRWRQNDDDMLDAAKDTTKILQQIEPKPHSCD